jgi:hypothetical protein
MPEADERRKRCRMNRKRPFVARKAYCTVCRLLQNPSFEKYLELITGNRHGYRLWF